ncbi:multidrug ABC transporter ATP-binding protein [Alkanindiges hydrocarboniclasticus]|uniref:Multidrug ABC transporter ATP-binding protein n=1 Tax=Alkanindiges hydrocarboniclasticus TaxID=1907941 RepID=A0A1S8CZ43_9GAMM|nr:ABC transporter ATP-binding protein [Alkanindiges hydrocarboniclasticus]ONG42135.1 multidrug ABC transporter ATP-binding protein [Alkanindiges hydrocarboniclasticus]
MFSWFEKRIHPYPDAPPPLLPQQFFAFIWQATKGTRGLIISLTVLTAIIGVFEALLFAMMGKMVDWLSNVEPALLWQKEGMHLALLAAVIVGSIVLVGLQSLIKHQGLLGTFPMRLRWNFHRQVLNQSLGFFSDDFAGRIATKVMQTSLAVRDVWMLAADILAFMLVYFVTLSLVMGSFSLWMLVPFFIWLTAYSLSMYYFLPRLGAIAKSQANARSNMVGRVTDAYTNIQTVKLFSHAGREAGYARESMDDFLVTVHQQMRLVTWLQLTNQCLNAFLILSTSGVALWLWSNSVLGIGAVAATTAMALRLNGFAQWIMWEISSLFENIGTVQDGINTLTKPQLIEDKPNATTLKVTQSRVQFDNVSFAYSPDKPILSHLNLDIQAGEKIGLVGRSGAGKSTLINLLLHFYEPQQGQILIDGQDISQVTQDSLRAQIGMVTQDTSLLHRSVRENILYGKPDASEAELIAAAQQAEADEFIAQLTDPSGRTGFDAHVGERGVKLSGGQRQRIAIARVMLKDAPILLLDEATSALDSEVEAAIQHSLYKLMQGKTVIAIAHRLSTIMAMDRLIVMDQGQIVEQGTHQELLALNGIYARLWAHQSGGFLVEDDTN